MERFFYVLRWWGVGVGKWKTVYDGLSLYTGKPLRA